MTSIGFLFQNCSCSMILIGLIKYAKDEEDNISTMLHNSLVSPIVKERSPLPPLPKKNQKYKQYME